MRMEDNLGTWNTCVIISTTCLISLVYNPNSNDHVCPLTTMFQLTTMSPLVTKPPLITMFKLIIMFKLATVEEIILFVTLNMCVWIAVNMMESGD